MDETLASFFNMIDDEKRIMGFLFFENHSFLAFHFSFTKVCTRSAMYMPARSRSSEPPAAS
jgi:hypothetical protein